MTAAAAKAAITPQQPATESQTPPGLRDVVAVETPAPHEVVVRLKKPNALLLEALNFSPVVSLRHGSAAGPFRRDARTAGKAGLGRFEGYYRGRADLESISHRRVPVAARGLERDAARRRRRALRGCAGGLRVRQESPNAHVATFLRPYVTALAFNVGAPGAGPRTVRRALNFAVDRAAVIDGAAGRPRRPRHRSHLAQPLGP